MHEEFVSKTSVIATLLWGVTFAMMVSAWAVAIAGPWVIAAMLATTGLAVSAVAATAQIRTYMLRIGNLIRAACAERANLRTMN